MVTLKLDTDFKDATVVWVIGGDNKQLLLDGVNAKGVRKNTLTGELSTGDSWHTVS